MEINGHQWQSMVISGHQGPSRAIKDHQGPSREIAPEGIREGRHDLPCTAPMETAEQPQEGSHHIERYVFGSTRNHPYDRLEHLMREAIRRTQRQSMAIRGPQPQSMAIHRNQTQSDALVRESRVARAPLPPWLPLAQRSSLCPRHVRRQGRRQQQQQQQQRHLLHLLRRRRHLHRRYSQRSSRRSTLRVRARRRSQRRPSLHGLRGTCGERGVQAPW